MSMTAYRYSSVHTRSRARSERKTRARASSRAKNDTRPSGERESGSYSGTRQRNRIQFGPS